MGRYDTVLIRYGELTTKGKNRKDFIRRLDQNRFDIILTEGLNRQIRRMCLALGYRVQKLKRIRVMNIVLGSLKEGSYRELTPEELQTLKKELGMLP